MISSSEEYKSVFQFFMKNSTMPVVREYEKENFSKSVLEFLF